MAILQTKKQSDLEKRLKLLRQQVYGRDPNKDTLSEFQSTRNSETPAHSPSLAGRSTNTSVTDLTYLYQDLSKIGILAGLAIGIQILLYILMRNHILNLKFF